MCIFVPAALARIPGVSYATTDHPPRPGTYVIYHGQDADGFGSAFAAWRALGTEDTVYIPVNNGDPLPEIPDNARVFILDFSWPRETLVGLWKRCGLTVIDHHKSAAEDLADLAFAHIDITKSAAVLTWEYFQRACLVEGVVPELLMYVQDRDLWQWELYKSREVSAALAMKPRTFAAWEAFDSHDGIDALREEGSTVLKAQRSLIHSMAASAAEGTIAGFVVPIANATVLKDEVCEELQKRHPDAAFVAVYREKGSVRTWSLRSGPEFDVSLVAKSYPGGGGHKQAAGFSQPLPAVVI
jgi:oligoribonuclease NrnB/cAMP/cGMP phosphodiesterase (DHH superfamily)